MMPPRPVEPLVKAISKRLFRRPGFPQRPVLWLFLIGLVLHGWLLLNDGIYWEGWLIHNNLAANDWDTLRTRFAVRGAPYSAYFFWYCGQIPNYAVLIKLVVFAAVIGAGVLTYRIAQITGFLGKTDGLWVAILSMSFPAYKVYAEISVLTYPICYCIFLLGFWMVFTVERGRGRRDSLLPWLGCCATLFFSYLTPSLLVFHFGFLVLFVLWMERERDWSHRQALVYLLQKRWFLIVLPFLHWAIKQIFFKPVVEYHVIVWSRLFSSFYPERYISYGVLHPFVEAFGGIARHFWFWLVLAILVWRPLIHLLRQPLKDFLVTKRESLRVFGFGLFLLLLGMIPYVVVKTVPSPGFGTRAALLIALPVSIMLVATARMIFGDGSRLIWQGHLMLALLVVAFGLAVLRYYIVLQHKWVLDRSIIANLKQCPNERKANVFWIDWNGWPEEYGGKYIEHLEWIAKLCDAWGKNAWVGLDLKYYHYGYLKDLRNGLHTDWWFSWQDFDPYGPQAHMIVSQMPGSLSPTKNALRYLYHRFFDPKGMDSFLRSLSRLEFHPLSEREAQQLVNLRERRRVLKKLEDANQPFMLPPGWKPDGMMSDPSTNAIRKGR